METTVVTARLTRRQEIIQFFTETLRWKHDTFTLHARFGSAFRTRVSEINKDSSCGIIIRNETTSKAQGGERSKYWGEPRNVVSAGAETPLAQGAAA